MARPKDPGLERTWRLRLRRQATSGLSILEFGAREGVSSASFYAWKRRLAARPPVARTDPALFVPLHLDPSPRPGDPAPGVAIERPHRVRLRCDAAPEPEGLGRLVAALAGLSPQEES
jgi:hypothetical protein